MFAKKEKNETSGEKTNLHQREQPASTLDSRKQDLGWKHMLMDSAAKSLVESSIMIGRLNLGGKLVSALREARCNFTALPTDKFYQNRPDPPVRP